MMMGSSKTSKSSRNFDEIGYVPGIDVNKVWIGILVIGFISHYVVFQVIISTKKYMRKGLFISEKDSYSITRRASVLCKQFQLVILLKILIEPFINSSIFTVVFRSLQLPNTTAIWHDMIFEYMPLTPFYMFCTLLLVLAKNLSSLIKTVAKLVEFIFSWLSGPLRLENILYNRKTPFVEFDKIKWFRTINKDISEKETLANDNLTNLLNPYTMIEDVVKFCNTSCLNNLRNYTTNNQARNNNNSSRRTRDIQLNRDAILDQEEEVSENVREAISTEYSGSVIESAESDGEYSSDYQEEREEHIIMNTAVVGQTEQTDEQDGAEQSETVDEAEHTDEQNEAEQSETVDETEQDEAEQSETVDETEQDETEIDEAEIDETTDEQDETINELMQRILDEQELPEYQRRIIAETIDSVSSYSDDMNRVRISFTNDMNGGMTLSYTDFMNSVSARNRFDTDLNTMQEGSRESINSTDLSDVVQENTNDQDQVHQAERRSNSDNDESDKMWAKLKAREQDPRFEISNVKFIALYGSSHSYNLGLFYRPMFFRARKLAIYGSAILLIKLIVFVALSLPEYISFRYLGDVFRARSSFSFCLYYFMLSIIIIFAAHYKKMRAVPKVLMYFLFNNFFGPLIITGVGIVASSFDYRFDSLFYVIAILSNVQTYLLIALFGNEDSFHYCVFTNTCSLILVLFYTPITLTYISFFVKAGFVIMVIRFVFLGCISYFNGDYLSTLKDKYYLKERIVYDYISSSNSSSPSQPTSNSNNTSSNSINNTSNNFNNGNSNNSSNGVGSNDE